MNIAGLDIAVDSRRPLSGGCIASVEMLTSGSDRLIYKKYTRTGIAEAEVTGIQSIETTNTIRVPHIIAHTTNEILMEFIPSGQKGASFEYLLACDLANLHKNTNSAFGFKKDNWLGETPQQNQWQSEWSTFFLEQRLKYQINRARKQGVLSSQLNQLLARVLERAPELLTQSEEPPALIHGDLWSGNIMCGPDGNPVIIDPAVSYSHREAELGMTTLFGGLGSQFYNTYNEQYPMRDGWQQRVLIYKLYHLLNHLNLFGKSYEPDCLRTASEI